MSRLAENLFLAWSDRARRSAAEREAHQKAPALFTPERKEQVETEFVKAATETGRWSE